MAEDRKRLSVTLVYPATKKPIVVPLKRFTAANYEEFTERESDVADEFARVQREADELDTDQSMEFDEKRTLLREFKRRIARLRLVATWRMLQNAVDVDAVKSDDLRELITVDPETDDTMLCAQDFTEVDRAVRSFRGLLGLTKQEA